MHIYAKFWEFVYFVLTPKILVALVCLRMTRSGRIRAPITRLCLPERQNATVQYFSSILLPEGKKILLFNNSRGKVQKLVFLAVQDATFYSEDKIDKKYLSTGR